MSKNTYTTGKGIVGAYAFITSPAKKYKSEEKEYKATVTICKEDGEALIAEMENVRNEFRKEYKKKKGKNLPNGDICKIKPKGKIDEETGDFVADKSGEYEVKLQKDVKKGSIKVIDSQLQDVTNKISGIGEGSEVRCMLRITCCEIGGKALVTLTPIAVQLLKLVEYGGVSDEEIASEFSVEDGYTFTASEDKAEEGNEETEEDDEEADF